MNSGNDFETFNKYLKTAYFKKAAEFAKDRQFDTAKVKEAGLDEYKLCMKTKKYHWALEIAVNFKLEKSKIKKAALNEYNELTNENNSICLRAAQLAIDYNLGRDKVVRAAEKALDYFIEIRLYDEAEGTVERFGLNSSNMEKILKAKGKG